MITYDYIWHAGASQTCEKIDLCKALPPHNRSTSPRLPSSACTGAQLTEASPNGFLVITFTIRVPVHHLDHDGRLVELMMRHRGGEDPFQRRFSMGLRHRILRHSAEKTRNTHSAAAEVGSAVPLRRSTRNSLATITTVVLFLRQ